MKVLAIIYILVLCVPSANGAQSDRATDLEVLARRGKGVVTQSEFTARVHRIPAEHRLQTLRDKGRLTDLVANMLLTAQIATDAYEAGYDENPVVAARMKLAADKELVDAWLQHLVDEQNDADFEQLAREYYLINKDRMTKPETVDVSHILISTKERSEEEARALVESLSTQLTESPSKFDELVLEFSEDPSVDSNQGNFPGVERGDMVKAFEDSAFSLKVGEISNPVKTKFGFHLIRLNARSEASALSFDEVKQQLITQETRKHEDRIKSDYISGLTSQDVEITEEALREMVRRQFGEEVLAPEAAAEKTE